MLKAYDGLEALELAAEQPVRLIIMDVMMRGWTACRR